MLNFFYSQSKKKNISKKSTHTEKIEVRLNFRSQNKNRSQKFIQFIFFRVAGTIGAILTCPLEVVKTRLQSSTAFTVPARIGEIPGASNVSTDGLLRPEQRRKLCTTILRKRPQVCSFI